jgi:putative sigma-54 modulation protein
MKTAPARMIPTERDKHHRLPTSVGRELERDGHPATRFQARARKPESLGRSVLPGWLPKVIRTETARDSAQIPAYIRAAEGDLRPDDCAHIRRKVGRRLGKFARSIERVSLRTEDVNGPRGGVDRVCRIKIVLNGLPSVLVERRESSLNVAVDGALAGAERAVRRALQRRRMKPLRRGRLGASITSDQDNPARGALYSQLSRGEER